jgi:hypothetical protein
MRGWSRSRREEAGGGVLKEGEGVVMVAEYSDTPVGRSISSSRSDVTMSHLEPVSHNV